MKYNTFLFKTMHMPIGNHINTSIYSNIDQINGLYKILKGQNNNSFGNNKRRNKKEIREANHRKLLGIQLLKKFRGIAKRITDDHVRKVFNNFEIKEEEEKKTHSFFDNIFLDTIHNKKETMKKNKNNKNFQKIYRDYQNTKFKPTGMIFNEKYKSKMNKDYCLTDVEQIKLRKINDYNVKKMFTNKIGGSNLPTQASDSIPPITLSGNIVMNDEEKNKVLSDRITKMLKEYNKDMKKIDKIEKRLILKNNFLKKDKDSSDYQEDLEDYFPGNPADYDPNAQIFDATKYYNDIKRKEAYKYILNNLKDNSYMYNIVSKKTKKALHNNPNFLFRSGKINFFNNTNHCNKKQNKKSIKYRFLEDIFGKNKKWLEIDKLMSVIGNKQQTKNKINITSNNNLKHHLGKRNRL